MDVFPEKIPEPLLTFASASASVFSNSIVKQPSIIVLAQRFRARVIVTSRPQITRARGTPGTSGPHGLVSKVERHENLVTAVAGYSRTSHARCFRLAPYEPRWTYRVSFRRPMLYPPLAETLTGISVFGTRERQTRSSLVTRGRRAGHRTAWAALFRPRTGTKPSPPRPALQNASRNAPRYRDGMNGI